MANYIRNDSMTKSNLYPGNTVSVIIELFVSYNKPIE